jgi:hypothetical protein
MGQLSDFSIEVQQQIDLIAKSWGTTAQYLIDNHYDFCSSLTI